MRRSLEAGELSLQGGGVEAEALGRHQLRMLAEISAKVSDINTNITNMQARTGEDQQARIDMTVEIKDVKHLERVIRSIKGVQGVIGVERTARA